MGYTQVTIEERCEAPAYAGATKEPPLHPHTRAGYEIAAARE